MRCPNGVLRERTRLRDIMPAIYKNGLAKWYETLRSGRWEYKNDCHAMPNGLKSSALGR